MTPPNDTGTFYIQSFWGPRGETPEAIANRYIRMVEALVRIDPVFTPWLYWGVEATALPFDQARAKLPALIAENVDEDWGPRDGYRFGGGNGVKFGSRSLCLSGQAGNSLTPIGISNNSVELETISHPDYRTDASFVTYELFRSAMLAIIEAWDVTWCAVYPNDLEEHWPEVREDKHFRLAWMTYVSPRFAPWIGPPRGIESQNLPGGGLLMVATRERFDIANPAHMAAARAIDTAMIPLNTLPWPPDP